MDKHTARKILRVEPDANFKEIRRRYRVLSKKFHPDNINTGDNNKFLTISAAYTILQAGKLGITEQKEANDDMEQALNFRADIEAYLEEVEEEYKFMREKLEEETIEYIEDKIFATKSTEELKKVIESDIANRLTDMKVQLKYHLKKIEKNAVTNNSDFLFKLFRDMYTERRKYWLLTLYRNPIIIGEAAGLAFIYGIKEFPAFREAFPSLLKITNLWWFPLSVILLGVFALLLQYIFLNPKRQFVPPAFSLGGLHNLIKSSSEDIKSSRGEQMTNGALSLGFLGTIILPGVGTIIGAGLGLLFGLGGKKLEEIKRETALNLTHEIEKMFSSLDTMITQWAQESKSSISKAAFESYQKNIKNISGFLNASSQEVKLLTEGK